MTIYVCPIGGTYTLSGIICQPCSFHGGVDSSGGIICNHPKTTKPKRHGRKKPYTVAGLKRLPCCRCGNPANSQWSACSDNNLYRPMCKECDIALNELVLDFMGDPEAKFKMHKYRKVVEEE